MKKMLFIVLLVTTLVNCCYAGQLVKNEAGSFYMQDDGTYAMSKWITDDLDGDGKKESYYFNEIGVMLENTVTPDGYQVNEKGQWVENGIVKIEGGNNYIVAGSQMPKLTNLQNEAKKIALLYLKYLPELSEKRLNKQVKYHMQKIMGYQDFLIDDAIAAIQSCNVDWSSQAVKAGKKYIKKNPDVDVEEVEAYLREICQFTKQNAKASAKRALNEYLKNGYKTMNDADFIADYISSGYSEAEAKRALQEVKKLK